jgi:drug/metabolite transporter (DMT)-like permease
MKVSKAGRIYLFMVFSMIFWGMSFIWYKQAFLHFGPITIILLRLMISAPLLLLSALVFNKLRWPRKKDLKLFMMLALFEPLLYFIGESYGLLYISSTLASVLIATIPLITPFIGYYLFKERLTVNNYMGIVVSFIGVILVVYIEGRSGNAPWFGILLIVLAILSTQGYVVFLTRLSRDYNALSIVWFQNLLGALGFLPLFLIFEAKDFSLTSMKLQDFLPVLYLSFFASSLAFLFFVQGVRDLGITKATVFTNFIPVVTALFAFFILNEKISVLKAVGIFVTITGLFMSQASGFPTFRKANRIR